MEPTVQAEQEAVSMFLWQIRGSVSHTQILGGVRKPLGTKLLMDRSGRALKIQPRALMIGTVMVHTVQEQLVGQRMAWQKKPPCMPSKSSATAEVGNGPGSSMELTGWNSKQV